MQNARLMKTNVSLGLVAAAAALSMPKEGFEALGGYGTGRRGRRAAAAADRRRAKRAARVGAG